LILKFSIVQEARRFALGAESDTKEEPIHSVTNHKH